MSANPRFARRFGALLRERAPIPAMLAVGVALQLAAAYVAGAVPSWYAAVLGGFGVAAVLIELRLMDEVKDFDKDRLAHPNRPLPRGLLTVDEMRRAIRALGVAMVVYAGAMLPLVGAPAAVLYTVTVAYAFLMYREFFVPRALSRNAFVYALAHQILVLPLCLFAAALAAAGSPLTARSYWFAVACVGASFTFELARKLDPRAHPALGTYLHRHGRSATIGAMVAAVAVCTFGAFGAGAGVVLWPFVALVLAALCLALARPARHRWVARAAAALVFALLLAPTLQHVLGVRP